jgi:hypothetical protein
MDVWFLGTWMSGFSGFSLVCFSFLSLVSLLFLVSHQSGTASFRSKHGCLVSLVSLDVLFLLLDVLFLVFVSRFSFSRPMPHRRAELRPPMSHDALLPCWYVSPVSLFPEWR